MRRTVDGSGALDRYGAWAVRPMAPGLEAACCAVRGEGPMPAPVMSLGEQLSCPANANGRERLRRNRCLRGGAEANRAPGGMEI